MCSQHLGTLNRSWMVWIFLNMAHKCWRVHIDMLKSLYVCKRISLALCLMLPKTYKVCWHNRPEPSRGISHALKDQAQAPWLSLSSPSHLEYWVESFTGLPLDPVFTQGKLPVSMTLPLSNIVCMFISLHAIFLVYSVYSLTQVYM